MDWSGVGYLWNIVMFLISCLDSHSDGTHSLQSIHCWASDEICDQRKDFQWVIIKIVVLRDDLKWSAWVTFMVFFCDLFILSKIAAWTFC